MAKAPPKVEVLYSVPASIARDQEGDVTFHLLDVATKNTTLIAKGHLYRTTAYRGEPSKVILEICSISGEIAFKLFHHIDSRAALDNASTVLAAMFTTVDGVVVPHKDMLNVVVAGFQGPLLHVNSAANLLLGELPLVVHKILTAIQNGEDKVTFQMVGDVAINQERVSGAFLASVKADILKTTGYTYDEIMKLRKYWAPTATALEID